MLKQYLDRHGFESYCRRFFCYWLNSISAYVNIVKGWLPYELVEIEKIKHRDDYDGLYGN